MDTKKKRTRPNQGLGPRDRELALEMMGLRTGLSITVPPTIRHLDHYLDSERRQAQRPPFELPAAFRFGKDPRLGNHPERVFEQLSEAVRAYFQRWGELSLSEPRLLMALTLLRKREFEAPSVAARRAARRQLRRALEGFHPPEFLVRGRPPNHPDPRLARIAEDVRPVLEKLAAQLLSVRNRDRRISIVAEELKVPRAHAQTIGVLLAPPAGKRKKVQEAIHTYISARTGESPLTVKRHLLKSRRHPLNRVMRPGRSKSAKRK